MTSLAQTVAVVGTGLPGLLRYHSGCAYSDLYADWHGLLPPSQAILLGIWL